MPPSTDKPTDPTLEETRAAAVAQLEQLHVELDTELDANGDSEKARALHAQIDELEAELAALADADQPDAAKKATPVKKAAAKKAAAPKSSELAEPSAPPVGPYLSSLDGNYHEPTVPAVTADAAERAGFKMAEADAGATHVSFEDGTTFALDAETGRIADKV